MNSSEHAAVALAGSSVATQAAEQLLFDAISAGAHTLHLEPFNSTARVRYRIDGVLQDWSRLSDRALTTLIAHFKHRAGLSPAERRWSQEGRFNLHVDGTVYSIKLTTLPLTRGEKAVLHIFNSKRATHELIELGIWGDTKKQLAKSLTAHQGLIVVSGPKHAGVSTTLRSLLNQLNKPSHSVVSIEDSPSPHLPGVYQLRVDRQRGLDLPQQLQTALQGDVNTISIGSLHGKEATDQALEAATKGRLLLTGMRTDSLLSTMAQLRDAASEQYLLAHNLQAVLHQQLVRRLCDDCKLPAKPTATQLGTITSRTRITIATLQHFMEEVGKHHPTATIQLFAANPRGCAACMHTGFKGRVGIFELFTPDQTARKRLAAHADPVTLLHNAVKNGMMPLVVDGFIKALCGLTTIDEVLQNYKGSHS